MNRSVQYYQLCLTKTEYKHKYSDSNHPIRMNNTNCPNLVYETPLSHNSVPSGA